MAVAVPSSAVSRIGRANGRIIRAAVLVDAGNARAA